MAEYVSHAQGNLNTVLGTIGTVGAAGNKLHAHLMKKANDPATAADGRKFYVWGHERASKKMAEIKMILDDMKRS